jgi:hypothetical protein
VLVERKAIAWAGRADYARLADLAEAVARLAGESGRPVRRVRAVLERETVQLRSVVPAPPLKPGAVRRYVSLEAPRLFRTNGAPLVTDARLMPVGAKEMALWAAAASEPLVRAVLDGCTEAGLEVESLGPAADVLPWALTSPLGQPQVVYPNGTTSEVLSLGPAGTWCSRLVTGASEAAPSWAAQMGPLGAEAGHFAPAYAAAIVIPKLQLLPQDTRAARNQATRRRATRIAAIGVALMLVAAVVHVGRLISSLYGSTSYLDANAAALDSALAVRRELATGRATLESIAAAQGKRSRQLAVLADITTALGDSVFLVALRIGPDGIVRLSGYARTAARALTDLERVRGLGEPKLEGAVTRESGPWRGELDRFAIVAPLERRP